MNHIANASVAIITNYFFFFYHITHIYKVVLRKETTHVYFEIVVECQVGFNTISLA